MLAVPTGPCASSDVVVAPTLTEATAGSEILITLELSTRVAEACTWTVSPETLTMKITSGPDDIWSSRQCPTAIPTREVVVRRAIGTKLGRPLERQALGRRVLGADRVGAPRVLPHRRGRPGR